jgi:hypothetical protein
MAADVVERLDRAGIAANNDDAFARDLPERIVALVGNVFGASGADPVFEEEAIELAAE